MKYIKRTLAVIILLLFPLILIADIIFGYSVTGVKTTIRQSIKEVFEAWKESYWD